MIVKENADGAGIKASATGKHEERRAKKKKRVKSKIKLVGEGDADFIGYFECMLYAGADGGAVEVIAGEVQAGEIAAKFFDGGETSGVA